MFEGITGAEGRFGLVAWVSSTVLLRPTALERTIRQVCYAGESGKIKPLPDPPGSSRTGRSSSPVTHFQAGLASGTHPFLSASTSAFRSAPRSLLALRPQID